MVIYENVLEIFDTQYSGRKSEQDPGFSPKYVVCATKDQKRLLSGPSLTLLGSTNRNTTIDSRTMISPINCSRPNLFPTTMTAEEAYQDLPKHVDSY